MSYYKRKRAPYGSSSNPIVLDAPLRVNYKQRRVSPKRPVRRMPRVGYVQRAPGGQITADNHYFDADRTSTTLPVLATAWTGTEIDPATGNSLFFPVQGDDITNRQGRKVFVKKIRIQGVINIATQTTQAAADEPMVIRLVVYQDKQTNGAQSQGEDLLSSGAASSAVFMSQNLANLGRFKVWKDRIITQPQQGLAGVTASIVQGGDNIYFKFSFKPMCYVNYNATNGGTIADVIDNSFHMIGNYVTGGQAATIAYKVRTVFTA